MDRCWWLGGSAQGLTKRGIIRSGDRGVDSDRQPDTARTEHTATLLPNGQVLVAGGFGGRSAEQYDPATGSWTATNSLKPARSHQTETLLLNGQVLVSGGDSPYGVIARTQLYKSAPEAFDTQ